MMPKCTKLPERLLMHAPLLTQCCLSTIKPALHLWEGNTGFLQ